MKNIVITGSSTGIGLGLAEELLKRDCRVVLTSFAKDELEAAYQKLSADYGTDRLAAFDCDVSDLNQIKELWKAASEKFGEIDVWVNNAGVSNSTGPFWQVAPREIHSVVNTNVVGTMYGCQVAIQEMIKQGHGFIFNFYGHGSWDEFAPPGLTVYGTSKRAVRYFTEAMIQETAESPVKVGWMMPGLVMTDFVDKVVRAVPPGPPRENVKKMISVVADTVETVTPWLADELLATVENEKHGAELNYMPPEKVEARKKDPKYLQRDLFAGKDI